MPIFFYKKMKGCKPYPKVTFTTLFCYIRKFFELPYIAKNAPRGCTLARMEICRKCDRTRRENFASEILCYWFTLSN